VVSRNLQRIAEDACVLKKVKRRWELTPLGVQINEQTKIYLEKQTELLSSIIESKKSKRLAFAEHSILIIINAQNGLLDATQEGRNNSEAERNIHKLLEYWRSQKRPVVHVKHASDNPGSFFFRQSSGYEILKPLTPQMNEVVIEKTNSSAFSHTDLEIILAQDSCTDILLVGFTANECIDATARDAAAKGFSTFVVGDATATFDLRDPSGKLVKAERIHKLTLANINAFYAKVVSTSDVLI